MYLIRPSVAAICLPKCTFKPRMAHIPYLLTGTYIRVCSFHYRHGGEWIPHVTSKLSWTTAATIQGSRTASVLTMANFRTPYYILLAPISCTNRVSDSTAKADESLKTGDSNTKSSDTQGPAGSGTPADKRSIRLVFSKKSAIPSPVSHFPSTRSNNLLTTLKACDNYCLKPEDLQSLPSQAQRSAYHGEKKVIYYLESDVRAKAIEVHGSEKAVVKAQKMQELLRQRLRLGALMQDGDRTSFQWFSPRRKSKQAVMTEQAGTKTVVSWAFAINSTLGICKGVAYFFTCSSSMFAEMIHSFADALNQGLLYFGLEQTRRQPDSEHPYGYSNFGYITSLISGVGVFFIGSGLSWYHAVQALIHPAAVEPLTSGFVVLLGALLAEGITLRLAYLELSKKAKMEGVSIREYIRLADDPSLNVVFMEDFAAVTGIGIAALAMGMSAYTGLAYFDACGSIMIGCLLAYVAGYNIATNTSHLMGKSIPAEEREDLVKELEDDVMVRTVQDVKATEMGLKKQKLKAEIGMDGRNVTRSYLEGQDLNDMLAEMAKFDRPEQVENFMLKHGEGIVDKIGAEIDRIEQKLMDKKPELRHVDLEVL